MKPRVILLLASTVLALGASPSTETNVYFSTVSVTLPDGPTSGVVDTIRVPQIQDRIIQKVTISLNLEVPPGQVGFTGDLYAYLQHGNEIAVLLNRAGKGAVGPAGYDDSISFSITFDDDAINGDIHNYRIPTTGNHNIPLTFALTGLWQPDARATDPDFVLLSDLRTATLRAFDGTNPSEDWALFLADLSSGGQHHWVDWSMYLETTVVPEPTTWALLATFGFLALAKARVPQSDRKKAPAPKFLGGRGL